MPSSSIIQKGGGNSSIILLVVSVTFCFIGKMEGWNARLGYVVASTRVKSDMSMRSRAVDQIKD